MIAKIGKGENLWGALNYNQQKVDQGNGHVLLTNKIPDVLDRPYTVQFFHQYFEPYFIANRKTEKPLRHISLNPHPEDKVDDSDYREMAQQYMQEMGYGQQPYVVFKHTDIDRTHIHIVTTCVQLNGKKIPDRYDRHRSMAVCRKLEKQFNLKKAAEIERLDATVILKPVDYAKGHIKTQLASVLRHLPQTYHFQSMGAYNSLLSQFNISLEQVDGELQGKMRKGIVYFATDEHGKKISPAFKSSLFGKHAGLEHIQVLIEKSRSKMKDHPSKPILKRSIETAMATSHSEASFKKQLLEQGIATVIRRNDQGRIFGITFIDHDSKLVWNGSQLGKHLSANSFNTLFNGSESKPENKSAHDDVNLSQEIDTEQFSIDSISGLFDGFFSDFLSSDSWNQEELVFEFQMKKRQRKRRKK